MKLSELKYGKHFLHASGGQHIEYIKSNRVEGGVRLCMTLRGEILDFEEETKIVPIEKEKENDEDHD